MSLNSLEQGTQSEESHDSFLVPSTSSEDKELQLIPLKPRKIIAKMKANNRKGYKRKVIEISEILCQQINSYNRFMLYGNIELENYYKDYLSPYENSLLDFSNNYRGIQSVEKSMTDMHLTINLFQKSCSGIRDFQFLIDHYSKIPDLSYWQLSQYLKQYQDKVNDYIQHTEDIAMRIKQRLISREEIMEAFNQYKMLFNEYIKSQVNQDEFYITSLGQLNLEFFENEQKYTQMSFALISLMGIEYRNFEMVILRNNACYLEQFGMKRLKQALFGLQAITSDSFEFTLQDDYMTVDNIHFHGISEVKIFVWKDRPSWMRMEDSIGVLVKLNIPIGQLKSILEIRSQMTPQKQFQYGIDSDFDFEYTVESEIFLEKFYPQLFGSHINKQSLELKKELLEGFQQIQQKDTSMSSIDMDNVSKSQDINN